MIRNDMATESHHRVDDFFDDAETAYKEVMGRTEEKAPAAKPEPEPEPVEVSGSDEPAAPTAGKEAKGKATKEADETPASGEKERDESGRFKSKSDRADAAGKDQQKAGEGEPPPSPAVTKAPPSFSVATKAAWDKLPEHVRADIAKREAEMANGLAALRDFKDLKPWAEMAQKQGATIGDLLKRYSGMENVIRKDIGAGLALIAQNFGLKQHEAAQLFDGLAKKFGAGKQDEPDDPVAAAISPHLKPLMDEIGGLKRELTSRQQAEQRARMDSLDATLKTMEADPAFPFVSDLIEDMTRLMENGFVPATGDVQQDLKAAYELAGRLNPQVHEALIEKRLTDAREAERKREREEVARAKSASRSVTGSKLPGTVTTPARGNDNDDPDDIMADVQAAYRAVHGTR